jgi:hypothetical protein
MTENSQTDQTYQPILDRDKLSLLILILADLLLRRLQTELDELRKNHNIIKEQNTRAVQLGISVEHAFKPLADELRSRQEQTASEAARKGARVAQRGEARSVRK